MATDRNILTCHAGDIIINIDRKVLVSEVICQGKEATKKQVGERVFISACRMTDTTFLSGIKVGRVNLLGTCFNQMKA